MPAQVIGSESSGVAFLVAAGIVFEIIAAFCSSPQTAELNAKARAETLMKWVNIGTGSAAGFVILAAIVDRRHRVAILGGGALAGVLMYGFYMHAKSAGLACDEPGTEDWGNNA